MQAGANLKHVNIGFYRSSIDRSEAIRLVTLESELDENGLQSAEHAGLVGLVTHSYRRQRDRHRLF